MRRFKEESPSQLRSAQQLSQRESLWRTGGLFRFAKASPFGSQLEEYRVYVQTKQYVEKVAKEKLGLVKIDEILFKAEESR